MTRVLLVLLCACAGNAKQIQEANQSRYDANIDVLQAGAVEAVLRRYPTLKTSKLGSIKTAWHQVDATSTAQVTNRGGTSGPVVDRYFIRFDVTIHGIRPWTIDVVGHGSRWNAGDAKPTRLSGEFEPSWVRQRTDSLRLEIHEQLAKYAVHRPPP